MPRGKIGSSSATRTRMVPFTEEESEGSKMPASQDGRCLDPRGVARAYLERTGNQKEITSDLCLTRRCAGSRGDSLSRGKIGRIKDHVKSLRNFPISAAYAALAARRRQH